MKNLHALIVMGSLLISRSLGADASELIDDQKITNLRTERDPMV